jgi:hypothetical protein
LEISEVEVEYLSWQEGYILSSVPLSTNWTACLCKFSAQRRDTGILLSEELHPHKSLSEAHKSLRNKTLFPGKQVAWKFYIAYSVSAAHK